MDNPKEIYIFFYFAITLPEVNSSPVFTKDQLFFRTSKHVLLSRAEHVNQTYTNCRPNTKLM